MSIMALVIIGLLLSICLAEGWLRAGKQKVADSGVLDKQTVVLRRTFIDATPAQLKVVHFAEGKVEGRLVMHGPYQGVVTRVLMLWKEDKHRSIKMDVLCGVEIDSIDKVYSTSVDEAKTIAVAVYGKRKKAPKSIATNTAGPQVKPAVSTIVHAVVKPKTDEPVMVPAVQVEAKPESVAIPKVGPIIKGFISQHVGKIVDAGMQSHVTTRNGAPETYQTFTLTLDTANGIERLTGNDLRRAVDFEGVSPGDTVRVIHIKDKPLSNGFKKKSFEIVRELNQFA